MTAGWRSVIASVTYPRARHASHASGRTTIARTSLRAQAHPTLAENALHFVEIEDDVAGGPLYGDRVFGVVS